MRTPMVGCRGDLDTSHAGIPPSAFDPGTCHANTETDAMNRLVHIPASAVIILAVALAAATTARASGPDEDAARNLARSNNCFKCHALSRDKDGPGWKKVAEKYRGNPNAEAKLMHHLTSGEMVKLADGSMVHHEIIKTDPPNDSAQIKNLVDWILSL